MQNLRLSRLWCGIVWVASAWKGCNHWLHNFSDPFHYRVYCEVEYRGPLMKTGVRQPPIKAYIDDLTVTTALVTGCKWLLRGLESSISWTRMRFKQAKSRSMVIKRDFVVDRFRFAIAGTIIPNLGEKPVKSIGGLYNCSMKDTVAIQNTTRDICSWLTVVDKSGLPGRIKSWIYQHTILPRILWPIMIYDTTMKNIMALERGLAATFIWANKYSTSSIQGTDERKHGHQDQRGDDV